MLYNRVLYIAIIILSTLNSCYHKELNYSFDTSSGGVVSGSSCYYLAHVREFQMPKGISTFPDGGMSRDVRQLFGLFKTDSLTNSTILITRMGEVVGWPSRYATRMEKNDSYIAIGIVNVTQRDSISGIYLYSIKSGKLIKYSKEQALPALSSSGSLMAYCIKNRLVVDDFSSKTTLFSYLLNFIPVFVTWKSDHEIYIFYTDPFRVKVLDISTGKTTNTDLKYIKNYNQELDISTINRMLKITPESSKEILDKYH
jgi:hypothetical protein